MTIILSDKNRIKVSEVLYFAFLVLFLFPKGIGLYDGQPVFRFFLVLGGFCWLLKMLMTPYTKKEIFLLVMILALTFISYMLSGEKGLFLYGMMVTGLKNISIKKVFKVSAFTYGITFLGMLFVHTLGILEGPFKVHEKYGMGMVIRWGAGYPHPNVFHITFFIIVMMLVFFLWDKYSIKHAIIFMVINIYVFMYSLSTTGLVATTVFLLAALYFVKVKNIPKPICWIINGILPLCLVYSLLLPVVLKGRLFEVVNKLSNTRLNLAKFFLTNCPFSFWGIRLSVYITDQLTMDNSFVFAYVTYGAVLFILIMAGYFLLVRRFCKQNRSEELLVTESCFLAGVMEPFLFNTSLKNISFFFMKELIFEEEKEGKYGIKWFVDRGEGLINLPKFSFSSTRKRIIPAIMGAVVGLVICFITSQSITSMVVPESACDPWVIKQTEDTIQYTIEPTPQMLEDSSIKIIGTFAPKERMIIYSGNMVRIETLRRYVSFILWGGLIFEIIYLFILRTGFKKKESDYEKNSDSQ